MQQYQPSFAQGNGDSEEQMDEPKSSAGGSTEGESGDLSDDAGVPEIGKVPQSEAGSSSGGDSNSSSDGGDGNATALQPKIYRESDGEQSGLANSSGDQVVTQPVQEQCTGDFALDPTTGECDSTLGPCPEGETRGESGYCAKMPEECPPGTYINEDPFCEPCPTEGQIPEDCDKLEPSPIPEPVPLSNETGTNQSGNTTFVTINNAIAQAFSSTTYNNRVLQQAAQNTLIVGEETISLQGQIVANGTRLLSTFDPFKLIGGSAIIYLPTSNISSPDTASHLDEMQILALDGDSNEVIPLPSSKILIYGNGYGYKTMLGEAFTGTNPFTGQQVTVDNIKSLFLFNGINQTVTFGYGSNVALLTIVR